MKRKNARKGKRKYGEFGVLDEDGGTIGRADDGDRMPETCCADALPPHARRRIAKKPTRA